MRRVKQGAGEYDRSHALLVAKAQAVETLKRTACETVLQGAAKALGDAAREMEEMLLEVAHGVVINDTAVRQKLFQQLGERAQETMVRSYDQLVTAREGPASATHYRAGAGRLAAGLMRKALEDQDFFTATPLGLEWGNREVLDGAAAQWHRLNFGAGGFGGASGSLGFDDEPSPAFDMPAGVWINPEGSRVAPGSSARGADAFYPQLKTVTLSDGSTGKINARPAGIKGRSSAMKATAGIEGKHFMERGLQKIAEELPAVMDAYRDEVYKGLESVSKRRRASAIVSYRSPASTLEIEVP
jgi:hypothetical protein